LELKSPLGGEICCELLIFVNGVAAGFEARLIAERIEKHFALGRVRDDEPRSRRRAAESDTIVNLIAVVSQGIVLRDGLDDARPCRTFWDLDACPIAVSVRPANSSRAWITGRVSPGQVDPGQDLFTAVEGDGRSRRANYRVSSP
jgi:hypothetical protein